MPNPKGNTVGINGPTWNSYPDKGCDFSRGRKCVNCIYGRCLTEYNVNRGFTRRWIELPLGEGEYLYCRDCGRQLYGTNSTLKDAPSEQAWMWIEVWDEIRSRDIIQIIVCSDCRKLDSTSSEGV